MEQEYIKGDIVIYDNKIHTIMDTLGVNNYELSYIEHPVQQLELSGVPLTPEIIEKNGWKIEDVNPNDLSNIVSKGIMYRAIKDKEILFFHKGASVFYLSFELEKNRNQICSSTPAPSIRFRT